VSRSDGSGKARRQQMILDVVARERLASQEEIRTRLRQFGIGATQSTISRDIEELGLARVHDAEGVRYVMPGEANGAAGAAPTGLLRRLLDEFALSVVRSDAGVLIRTPPGAASALAEGIDRVGLADVAGTVAGDNTILVLGREGVQPRRLEETLMRVMEAER
jgi:transcriptional regulator of arginine metabolism